MVTAAPALSRIAATSYAVRNDTDFPEHPETKESADPALRMSNPEPQGHSIKQSYPCVANTSTVTCELGMCATFSRRTRKNGKQIITAPYIHLNRCRHALIVPVGTGPCIKRK